MGGGVWGERGQSECERRIEVCLFFCFVFLCFLGGGGSGSGGGGVGLGGSVLM